MQRSKIDIYSIERRCTIVYEDYIIISRMKKRNM